MHDSTFISFALVSSEAAIRIEYILSFRIPIVCPGSQHLFQSGFRSILLSSEWRVEMAGRHQVDLFILLLAHLMMAFQLDGSE